MYTRTEQSLGKFIDATAHAELDDLERLGGRPLRVLARSIYIAFGLSPGEDQMIARALSILPMRVDRRLPSFYYWHRGQKGLLQHTDRRNIHSIAFSITGTDSKKGYGVVYPARTPVLERFVDGADVLHAKLGHRIGRGGLYLHVLSTTVNTATFKRLTW